MKLSQSISGKDVAKYIFMPGIMPRLRAFARTGFGGLAYLMASIYYSVRLLPKGHPYLNPANKGRYGIRHVIAEAARRLVFKRENIDQIIIFCALGTSFVLLILQFIYLFFILITGHAFAGAPAASNFSGMFTTQKPTLDIAFMLLDSVFGIPGMFGSCIATNTSCGGTTSSVSNFPTPFQSGLQALFSFYSLAILLIAVLIFVYYVFVVIAETAQTGTPFGKRFDHIWAPIRLVVALGLLVPVNYGLNTAQYITLFAAKLGSGFATNAWLLYNNSLDNAIGAASTVGEPITVGGTTYAGADASSNNALIARPSEPTLDSDIEFMSLVKACKVAYETLEPADDANTTMDIEPYLISTDGKTATAITAAATPDWTTALKLYNNKDIVIRFGQMNATKYPNESGNVKPYCGEITVYTKDLSTATALQGTALAQQGYYNWITQMWFNDDVYGTFGTRAYCVNITDPPPKFSNGDASCDDVTLQPEASDDPDKMPSYQWKQAQVTNETSAVYVFLDQAYKDMLQNTDFKVDQEILDRGWGGAGIWYNKIAQWNGALFSTSKYIPAASHMPLVMEDVQNKKRQHDKTTDAEKMYEPVYSDGTAMPITGTDRQIAVFLNQVYAYWRDSNSTQAVEGTPQGNVIINIMHLIFGVDGLFDIRHNDNVNPLAQLVAIGKSIIDGTIRNVLIGMAGSFGAGYFGAIGQGTAAGLSGVVSQFATMFSTMGLTVGFTLYYVLPFMPFIYFYFAVGAWVKTVFEAMIGVPLWALAHLKIDGTGLPAESAMTGYFLIFEIFLRPILCVISMVASIAIFTAMVRTLNGIFSLVVQNATGFDCSGCTANVTIISDLQFKRSVIDDFFFTILYTILVYMMATSSFKMIDQIPDNILRWMSAGVATFEDRQGDPGDKLAEYASLGANQVGQQVIPVANQAANLGGQATGQATKALGSIFDRNTSGTATGKP